jgi:ketopantoate reductase
VIRGTPAGLTASGQNRSVQPYGRTWKVKLPLTLCVSAEYGPSLLIDMEHGRPTEGQHTIGDLVDRANSCGVSVPLLTAVLCNLQACEVNRRAAGK